MLVAPLAKSVEGDVKEHKDQNIEINPSLSDEHVWVQFLDKVHDNSGTGAGLEQQQTPAGCRGEGR